MTEVAISGGVAVHSGLECSLSTSEGKVIVRLRVYRTSYTLGKWRVVFRV